MRYRTLGWLGMVLAGAGCSTMEGNPTEPLPPPPPPSAGPLVLAIFSGNDQEGVVWQPTLSALAVRLTAGGQALPSRTVTWIVEEGTGEFYPVTGVTATDLNGVAWVRVLPTSVGVLRVRAQVSGVEPVHFTASLHLPEVAVVSGDAQDAATGDPLQAPLAVRVTDGRGALLPGARVVWRFTQGSGEFTDRPWVLDSIMSSAGEDGLASITLRPYSPGTVTVEARVENVDHPPAVFSIHATGPFTTVIRYGPLFDCGEQSTFSRLRADPIRVGYRVIFENTWCPGRVRAVSVPPGATSFASEPLPAGGRFAIIVSAAGVYVVEDAVNLGMGSFAVAAP
jgi:hypothetical protein